MKLESYSSDIDWIRKNETKEVSSDSEGLTNLTTLKEHKNIKNDIDLSLEKLEEKLDEINKKMRECKEMKQAILTFAKEKGINLKNEKNSEIDATKQEITGNFRK